VALRGFVARIQAITTDMIVSEQLIEVVAHIIERLPDEPLLALLLANDRTNLFSRRMLLPDEIARCRAILQHTHIDWAALGYNEDTLDELVEFLLRIIQSMVIAPPEPPRSGIELRAYLRRWIGPQPAWVITDLPKRSIVSSTCARLSPGNPTCTHVTPTAASFSRPAR
jgi:hypothetical protein